VTKHQMPHPVDQPRLWGHVASLPCQRPDCWGLCGPVQVSHSNQGRDGKGMGLKAYPWRVAALGAQCHHELDQGNKLSKAERREQWDEAHRATMGELFSRGLVRPV
jgi:hypothetical protein